MNRITLQGRLAADPELRYTPNGVAVATFTLAVQRSYKNQNGEYGVDFIPCVAWRKTGEFVNEWLAKGTRVAVDGRLETRTYEDQSGNRRKVYEVIVEKVYPIDWKASADPFADDGKPTDISDEDLPF